MFQASRPLPVLCEVRNTPTLANRSSPARQTCADFGKNERAQARTDSPCSPVWRMADPREKTGLQECQSTGEVDGDANGEPSNDGWRFGQVAAREAAVKRYRGPAGIGCVHRAALLGRRWLSSASGSFCVTALLPCAIGRRKRIRGHNLWCVAWLFSTRD